MQPCICPQSLTFTLHLVTSACQHCHGKYISSLVLAFSSRQGAARSVIECYFLIMWTLITDRDADSVKGLSHNQPAKQYAKVWEATSKWCSSLVLKWNNVRQIQQETNLSVPLLYLKLQKWKIKFTRIYGIYIEREIEIEIEIYRYILSVTCNHSLFKISSQIFTDVHVRNL